MYNIIHNACTNKLICFISRFWKKNKQTNWFHTWQYSNVAIVLLYSKDSSRKLCRKLTRHLFICHIFWFPMRIYYVTCHLQRDIIVLYMYARTYINVFAYCVISPTVMSRYISSFRCSVMKCRSDDESDAAAKEKKLSFCTVLYHTEV